MIYLCTDGRCYQQRRKKNEETERSSATPATDAPLLLIAKQLYVFIYLFPIQRVRKGPSRKEAQLQSGIRIRSATHLLISKLTSKTRRF